MTKPADNDLTRARRSLDDAITLVRNREADRQDVVVDMADAERQRLELLLEELIDIREGLRERGEAAERFDFAVAQGVRPRLWIDAVAWVQMGADRRTYRFLRETAAGRALAAETSDIDLIASTVTDYVAERLVERERRVETEYALTPATPRPGDAHGVLARDVRLLPFRAAGRRPVPDRGDTAAVLLSRDRALIAGIAC